MIALVFHPSSLLVLVMGFCAICAAGVLLLVVSIVGDWVKLRRIERERREEWEWERKMELTSLDFEDWRAGRPW